MRCFAIYLNISIFIQVLGIGIVATMLLSFWKMRIVERLYLGMGFIVAITGIVGLFLVHDALVESLDHSVDQKKFIQWALSKFDTFALWSLLLLVIIIVALLLYIWKNKRQLTSDKQIGLTVATVFMMVVFPIAAIVYGFGTINKEFDVAAYILTFSICELSILYIPLLFKRIMAKQAGIGGR